MTLLVSVLYMQNCIRQIFLLKFVRHNEKVNLFCYANVKELCIKFLKHDVQFWRFSWRFFKESKEKKTLSARKYYNNKYDVSFLTDMIGWKETIFVFFSRHETCNTVYRVIFAECYFCLSSLAKSFAMSWICPAKVLFKKR